jgi:hypothetical protein
MCKWLFIIVCGNEGEKKREYFVTLDFLFFLIEKNQGEKNWFKIWNTLL